MSWRNLLQKARFTSSVVVVNTAALLFACYIFSPTLFAQVTNNRFTQPKQPDFSFQLPTAQPVSLPAAVISGTPVKIEVIAPDNGMHIDLPVAPGYFDAEKRTWTLSNDKAYFAVPSVPANDTRGTTLIYGHNESHLFSHLSSLKQNVGAHALVHTDNGKIFRYAYESAQNLQPDDVTVFKSEGAPTLVIQTCVGDWFELRRMYRFSFVSVKEQP